MFFKTMVLIAVFVCFWAFSVKAGEIDTTYAIIHHTASPDVSVDEIRRWHMTDNKWRDIGYHFVIRKNGDIETGRSLDVIGAHARGRNRYVGIALTGYDDFTLMQLASLNRLLEDLGSTSIEAHHEMCPWKGLERFIATYNKGRR